ncbi:PepSY-associated TM helix domain-containing protein [Oceanospirillum sediminis]|uniref:PepSY domain-containing protein n=1 Tax=Oceanospirillum sediminis TaxID=2760088 RepID=A0A839IMJ7_9GAMM|nr:PepSY domain-containing protein [Oceanospirillum sediminis]MBB1485940.1 PepSY domain-containing protein [Oceanospirillum sediminis]
MSDPVLEPPQIKTAIPAKKARYCQAWRWHFFAGLYAIPFMLMLAITGMIMLLFRPLIEPALYSEITHVQPGQNYLSWEQQRYKVAQAYPDGQVTQLTLPKTADESSRFLVKTSEGTNLQVFINPYTGDVLGNYDKNDTLYALADEIHGTFLLGKTGDALIELSMGFSLVLLITGFYMWWPRLKQRKVSFWKPSMGYQGRSFWKELHGVTGVWLSAILVFFIITGLSWTGIWGARIVQPWNSFPAGVWGGVPVSDQTHATLNPGVNEEVPWNLELVPMPESGSLTGKPGIPETFSVNLDTVVAYGKDNGMTTFRVSIPQSETGVYTLMAATMSGDITDARQDRTIHIDQYTGNKLGDIGYNDYSLIAKSMATGIGLHMGLWGNWNLVSNLIACLLTIFLCAGGCVLWWKRRPSAQKQSLNAPPLSEKPELLSWKAAVLIWASISVFVPLMGAAVILILIADSIYAMTTRQFSNNS